MQVVRDSEGRFVMHVMGVVGAVGPWAAGGVRGAACVDQPRSALCGVDDAGREARAHVAALRAQRVEGPFPG